jgi:hypothetical protein
MKQSPSAQDVSRPDINVQVGTDIFLSINIGG